MLQSILSDIPLVVLLRSDKILSELINSLSNPINPMQSSALMDGVKDFLPNRFRRNDIEAAVNSVLPGKFSLDYGFGFLDSVFARYFHVDGHHISAHENLASDYCSLIRYVHPFSIIGYRLSQLYMGKKVSFVDIENYCSHVMPLAIKRHSLADDYADNHIHLNGCNETPSSLLDLANQDRTSEKLYSDDILSELPRIHDFTLINEQHHTVGQLVDIFKETHVAINRYTLFGPESIKDSIFVISEILKKRHRHTITTSHHNLAFLGSSKIDTPGPKRNLLYMAVNSFKSGNDEEAWLVYNILLYSLYQEQDSPLLIRRLVKIFIHLSNILRSYMIMSHNVGLTHFVEFFNSPVRKPTGNHYKNVARNIVLNGTNCIEGKISPNAFKSDEFRDIMGAFEGTRLEDALLRDIKIQGSGPGSLKYHFSVHFIRKKGKLTSAFHNKQRLAVRNAGVRKTVKKETDDLDKFLFSSKDNNISCFEFYRKQPGGVIRALNETESCSNKKIFLPHLIASLDVAGDENSTPPEVYAPYIRYLRSKKVPPLPHISKLKMEGISRDMLHLSVHAGEDFSHIVSGLRKIDETVRFYEMANNDRLGHALALGLDPKEWAKTAGEIYITTEELLDNLVWLWHYALILEEKYDLKDEFYKTVCDSNKIFSQLLISKSFSVKYEEEILKLGKEVYTKDYSAKQFFEAWQLRRNCPLEASLPRGSSFLSNDRIKHEIPDYLGSSRTGSEEAYNIYEMYHHDSDVRRNGAKPLILRRGNILTTKNIISMNDIDLDFLEAIQDLVIAKYSDLGIIIETNPSSNIFISDIESYASHPIFRWNPISSSLLECGARYNKFGLRKDPIRVCINTDDPAVFVTTLQNEFRLIENAAQEAFNVNKKEACTWVNNIKDFGVQIFNENHLSPYM